MLTSHHINSLTHTHTHTHTHILRLSIQLMLKLQLSWRTSEASAHHTRIPQQPPSLLTLRWWSENFVIILLTVFVDRRPNRQSNRQTKPQTDTTEKNTTLATLYRLRYTGGTGKHGDMYWLIHRKQQKSCKVIMHIENTSGGNSVLAKLGNVKVLDSGQKITE